MSIPTLNRFRNYLLFAAFASLMSCGDADQKPAAVKIPTTEPAKTPVKPGEAPKPEAALVLPLTTEQRELERQALLKKADDVEEQKNLFNQLLFQANRAGRISAVKEAIESARAKAKEVGIEDEVPQVFKAIELGLGEDFANNYAKPLLKKEEDTSLASDFIGRWLDLLFMISEIQRNNPLLTPMDDDWYLDRLNYISGAIKLYIQFVMENQDRLEKLGIDAMPLLEELYQRIKQVVEKLPDSVRAKMANQEDLKALLPTE